MVEKFPQPIKTKEEVFMALIRNFPRELGFWEALIYPSLKSFRLKIVERRSSLSYSLEYLFTRAETTFWSMSRRFKKNYYSRVLPELFMILLVPVGLLYPIYQLILLVSLVLCIPFLVLYFLLWKALAFTGGPIKHIEKKKNEYKKAKELQNMIFNDIVETDVFERAILEAVRLDAYEIVSQILSLTLDPMKTEKGYEIIHVAVTNRSSKVYKHIRGIIDGTEYYTDVVDASGNTFVHLAGKLPPSVVLRSTRGAALQLQRELQWFEEVMKFAETRDLTQRNHNDETPEMVFTREHADLVKEGENWMKTTAESCSITAALIVTIVFAAAITVPGGNNQEAGTPLFRKEIAFIIFAVSDAISLSAATTALSVFLSILTTRFAEKDFQVILPRRLFIGLFLLLLSTTAMMVAFSTILFLVFCDKEPWMLAPIGILACVPIAAIVGLQFPLMVDLFRSTYFPVFGRKQRGPSHSFKEE